MNPNYIIVQAGGQGTRMESLTRNKPKALIPVDNLPMLFHLFRKYPDKKFVVIGDYKFDVLEKYLKAFSDADYQLVHPVGRKGTCAGLREALAAVPDGEPLALIWCDLILPPEYDFPETDGNYVGVAKDFPCRWSYQDGTFAERPSSEHGVAGFFLLRDKSILSDVPEEGELVRFLAGRNINFLEQPLFGTHEYGLYREYEKLPVRKCRPFNQIERKGDVLVKRPLDAMGEKLAEREAAWYRKISLFRRDGDGVQIPQIYDYAPLTMSYVDGKNIYEYDDLPHDQKRILLEKIVSSLKALHAYDEIPSDRASYFEAYIGKTKERLKKVRNLVPFADQREIVINGRPCRNVFYFWDEIEKEVARYFPKSFVLLHGDCTFSNLMLGRDGVPVLIDPRGYFGNTELYGDAAYDWVKLYYSLSSNYDQFNLKRFSLDIGNSEVYLQIESSHWEDMEEEFFSLLEGEVSRKQMKLLLAIVWLSLTTYAWEDYDSICGAFYNGLLYLEEALLTSEEGTGDRYFGDTVRILTDSLRNLDMNRFEALIEDADRTINRGHKLVFSGLGKNVPVCEKAVGTLNSLGLDANFLHTNSAVHGDMGMIKPGDMVILLSKSGNTAESVYLAELLLQRDISLWLLTFSRKSRIEKMIGAQKCLTVPLEHEGDPWNIVPNNSTTLNLIILQGLAMALISRRHLTLERDFRPNHPGGAIGDALRRKGGNPS